MARTKRKQVYASSGAVTASFTSAPFSGFGFAKKLKATARVANAPTGTNPSLTLKLQDSVDGGTTWNDVISFTALTAAGAETKSYAEVEAASPQVVGDLMRVSGTVSGTTPSFSGITVDLYGES